MIDTQISMAFSCLEEEEEKEKTALREISKVLQYRCI